MEVGTIGPTIWLGRHVKKTKPLAEQLKRPEAARQAASADLAHHAAIDWQHMAGDVAGAIGA